MSFTLRLLILANANDIPIGRGQPDRNDATEYSDGNRAADARFCSFLRDGRFNGSLRAS